MKTTARLRLRPLSTEDAPAIQTIWSEPDVARWLPYAPTPLPNGAAEAYLSGALADETRYARLVGVERLDDRRFIGVVSVRRTEPAFRLGYYVAKSDWSRGFATEAVGATVDDVFEPPETARVEAAVYADNAASAAVLTKLGFTEVGRSEEPSPGFGGRVESRVFVLDHARWKERRR